MKRKIFLALMLSALLGLGYHKGESRNIEEKGSNLTYRWLDINDVADSLGLLRKDRL